MLELVDISSSPEPSASSMSSSARVGGHKKKRPRTAQPAREPAPVEIIELTDSDSERPMRLPSKRHRARAASRSPSHAGTSSFGKPSAELLPDAPGPSRHAPPRPAQRDVPLFLPASDDEQQGVPRPSSAPPNASDQRLVHPQLQPPEPPASPPPAPLDPVDGYVARVLEIVPDVQPYHAVALIKQLMVSQPDNVVEFVLHALFENPYPKVDKKGKHRRDDAVDDSNARASPKPRVDYTSEDRVYNCGPHYFDRSLEQLMMDFPRIPKPFIRNQLLHNKFYAPTHLFLAEELKKDPLPFKLKMTNSVVSKGKARQDPEFDEEREWVLLKVAEMAAEERDAAMAVAVAVDEYGQDDAEGIECGCCFSEYPFDQMIQCPEAHLFCKSCMISYASNLLGEHNPSIVCMDQSGCKLSFPESELVRFLSSKLLELYHRVKQRKEIEAAGLENLEECPFCEYKCVIENEMEKLFRCENPECNAITCRLCKKPDHLPKTCKEMEEDKHLDAQHVVEEAMTQALMRNCPKCQKSFIKEMGCNKMTCPNCHTVSCYVCRKVINGYDHFSNPPPYTNASKSDKSKCNLWDPVEQRHAEEVSEAAKRALAELRRSRPDVDEKQFKVDIPIARTTRQSKAGGVPVVGIAPGPAAIRPPRALVGQAPMGMGPGGPGAGAGGGGGRGGGGGGGGVGVGMGAVHANPFVFGAGQGHQFVPPAPGIPPLPPYHGPQLVPGVMERARRQPARGVRRFAQS